MADVVTYTDPGCPHCRHLKQYLTRHHIPFENRDVVNDPTAAADFQKLNAPGVPVTVIGKDVIVGFDQDRIEDALRANGVTAGSAT